MERNIGLDSHKVTISHCVKDSSGTIHADGAIPAARFDLNRWIKVLPQPWTAAMTERNYLSFLPVGL
jgi:hypothetical protein